MPKRSAIVIGSGFAGLSAASFLARDGWTVTVIEKHDTPGGRARQIKEQGFLFDRGPSFYWMPGIFERYFQQFDRKVSDYYNLSRLDPSYRVYWNNGFTDIPANYNELRNYFEATETGAGHNLDKYLKEAAYKYQVGMQKLVFKPGRSLFEFMDWQTLSGIFRLQVFSSIKSHIEKYFHHPKLRQLMEFPILFLGALPKDTPALYSLMNYADIIGGTWYPEGGMYSVVQGMYKLAMEQGVQFRFNEEVSQLVVEGSRVVKLVTSSNNYEPDVVVSGADYHFTEKKLLAAEYRNYSEKYWDKRVMAPSCLMFYVGLNRKLKQALHHLLFFDVPFDQHGDEIYKNPKWPNEPLFYVSVASVTDDSVCPEGHENLVFLVPVAAGLEGDTEELKEKYFQLIVSRMEKHLGEPIHDAIVYKRSYSVSDFANDYNSFRGNAYGLANTLRQTALFKPSCRNKRVKNLFYTGQLTVPGPGVPPSLISGEIVAKQVSGIFK